MESDGPDTQPLSDEEDAVVTPKGHPDTPNTWVGLCSFTSFDSNFSIIDVYSIYLLS